MIAALQRRSGVGGGGGLDAGSFIFTTAPESAIPGLNELRRRDDGVRLLRWLAPGVGLARTDRAGPDDAGARGFTGLAGRLREDSPIFVRHVCPAQIDLDLCGDASDLERLKAALPPLLAHAQAGVGTSVQARLLDARDALTYTRFDVHETLARVISHAGFPVDVRRPGQIVSIVLADARAYAGVSPAAANLSDWAGGERRFAREEGQISRAEFKLLEAGEVFGLHFPASGTALDLGAAPGGWTRVLRRHGLRVVSVDPADLHPALAGDPGVTHERMTAQQYLRYAAPFDIVVNDMKMDAGASCELMNLAAQRLAPSGLALITLKLPQKNQETCARMALDRLAAHYRVLGARQLFHNRSEVTVAMQNRVE